MMTSFFSAVSGLKSQQTALDVIANNIANVNTTGYKQQRVSFSDLLSQTLSGASAATATTGGTNAKQVGLGVSVASTDTIMTTGSTQSTGVSSDVSISGSGFLIVQGGSTGEYQFTRNGSLAVDSNGNLNVNGYLVCGWQDYSVDADGNYVFNTDAEVEPINIYTDSNGNNLKMLAADATEEAIFSGNLDPSASVATNATALNDIGDTTDLEFDQTSSITVYDAQGNSYDVAVKWKKCYTDSGTTSWYWEASSSDVTLGTPSSGYIAFDSTGKIITTYATNYNTEPSLSLTTGLETFSVAMDFTGISTYTSSTTSKVTGTADGYEAGELQSWSISSDGTIVGTYSNGQTQSLAQIALAVFTNPEGLEKVGSNLYAASMNSGNYTTVVAGTGGSGSLSAGTLEMSNVDLASQFSQMMISQRAYQANSKVITTADDMLQSVINMIR